MVRRHYLVLVLLATTGCAVLKRETAPPHGVDLSFVHPLADPGPEAARLGEGVPQAEKDRTHIFFVNGFDPIYYGNFNGLGQYLKGLGFCHCYGAEMTQTARVRTMANEIHARDPGARLVLVGYSVGANAVCRLAHELREDKVAVDLLVYIGGDTLANVAYSRPENAVSVVNITGHGHVLIGYDLFCNRDIQGACNQRIDARHMLLPSQAKTAELLVRHLAERTPK